MLILASEHDAPEEIRDKKGQELCCHYSTPTVANRKDKKHAMSHIGPGS